MNLLGKLLSLTVNYGLSSGYNAFVFPLAISQIEIHSCLAGFAFHTGVVLEAITIQIHEVNLGAVARALFPFSASRESRLEIAVRVGPVPVMMLALIWE